MDYYTEIRKIIKNEIGISVILWGAGNYYNNIKDYIKHSIAIDYIHDKKWDKRDISEFDGYSIISFEEMKHIGKCTILLCLQDKTIEKQIRQDISENMLDTQIYQLRDIIPIGRNLRKEEIIDLSVDGTYKDFYGNHIQFETPDSLNKVNIQFIGSNAKIRIGRGVWTANELNIVCGNDAFVGIGNKTTFDKTTLYSSYGKIQIGDDCMFSYEVFLRNHDSHFIFDAETGHRINYCRNITIKNHVWVGQNSLLLGGFAIGDDSIVGAGSISSSNFSEQVVIAGNPARVIREKVIWDRAMTWTENYETVEELDNSIC